MLIYTVFLVVVTLLLLLLLLFLLLLLLLLLLLKLLVLLWIFGDYRNDVSIQFCSVLTLNKLGDGSTLHPVENKNKINLLREEDAIILVRFFPGTKICLARCI